MTLRLLETSAVEKVWGREDLPPPFAAPDGKRIGEIWFDPTEQLPQLLGKYLFTSEKLSVQVHPPGKDECWLVLDCEPDAKLAVGFDREYSRGALRAGAQDGTIEQMLAWHTVRPGDFVYLAAGTVHAIGPGCTLLEMQQNGGVTYRFYDYGRPRELHLEEALSVADCGPHAPALRRHVSGESECLVDGPFFRLDRVVGRPDAATLAAHDGHCLVLPLEQALESDGLTVVPGQCALADNLAAAELSGSGIALVASPR